MEIRVESRLLWYNKTADTEHAEFFDMGDRNMLRTKDIVLRDFQKSDIEKRLYWETEETEWRCWDSPWETEGLTGSEKQAYLRDCRKRLTEEAETVFSKDEKRKSFQIDVCGEDSRHIGWVASYYLSEHYVYTTSVTPRCAVGINIPDISARGRGLAYQALYLFIRYLLDHGETELYLQTWSGNERMIHIAEKLGFEECCRKKGQRTVRGRTYDGLTLLLNKERFEGIRMSETPAPVSG